MDNLTHSLAGAVLGQMGLKTKTGLAMPTLIIAANLPDIDAVAVLLGGHQHLAIRRGITHGPIAMLILPILLWAAMLAWDKWRPSEKRLPVHKGWLLTLAYIGTLSHPALDWLNVYGIRLLEPFSSQWFYGDTLFIIDVWIWTALAIGVWLSLRREKKGHGNWQRPAWVSFTVVCSYIFLNGLITGVAESTARYHIQQDTICKDDDHCNLAPSYRYEKSKAKNHRPDLVVVASPVPFKFWEREILWRTDKAYNNGEFSAFSPLAAKINRVHLPLCDLPPCFSEEYYEQYKKNLGGMLHGANKLTLAHAQMVNEDGDAYVFWSRMPVVKETKAGPIITDQRFTDPRVGDRFTLKP